MSPRAAADAPRLSDADLVRMMSLIKEADSVELKLTVPADAQRATVANLPIDPVEAQPRQVFFFDTPDLALYRAGVVVRARRIQGGRADTVVKLRPVEPSKLPDEVRHSAAFNVEVDALPGGFMCSGSMKGRSTGQEVRDAVAGLIPVRKLFTKEQRAFYQAHAPAGLDLDGLHTLGPTFLLKGVFTPKVMARRFVVEMWLYPDGSRILELSTKCLPSEAFQVAAEARAYLADRGIVVSGAQQTKTKTALEFFESELKRVAAAEAVSASTAAKRRTPAKTTRATKGAKATKGVKATKAAPAAKAATATARATAAKAAPAARATATAAKAPKAAKATTAKTTKATARAATAKAASSAAPSPATATTPSATTRKPTRRATTRKPAVRKPAARKPAARRATGTSS